MGIPCLIDWHAMYCSKPASPPSQLINNQTNVAINNAATSYLVVLISRSYEVKVTVNLGDLTTHALMKCVTCAVQYSNMGILGVCIHD